MRTLFIFLLLVNILYLGWELERGTEINRQDISESTAVPAGAKRLKLISESATKPEIYQPETASRTNSGGPNAIDSIFVHPDNQLVTELPDISTVDADAGSGKKYCYRFGPIEEKILATGIGDWFNSRRAKTYIHYTDEKGNQLFWVYLAPDDAKQTMNMLTDLKKKGIQDYHLISRGNLQNTISLGLYTGQTAVNKKIAQLKEQGYKPVVVPYANGKRVYWVDVQLSMDPGSLAALFKGYPSRYNYVPVDCSKTAMSAAG